MATEIEERISGMPEWLEPSFTAKSGRDPLGFQTITHDRVMPWLLPGVLELSRRARYFSFHPFLLDEYERAKLPASNRALSDFIRAKEYEFRIASELCTKGCGAGGVVGTNAVRIAPRQDSHYLRGLSVESHLGGYGLYYRSPLAELNVVALAGSMLGDEATPLDVLRRDERAHGLADTFRDVCEDTDYYKNYLRGNRPIPEEVLREYADVACPCRLPEHADEVHAVRELLLGTRGEDEEVPATARRQAFSLFLALTDETPAVATSPAHHREALWESFVGNTLPASATEPLARWAALIAKDWLQEAVGSIWLAFCRHGLATQGSDGLTMSDLGLLIRSDLIEETSNSVLGTEIDFGPETPASDLLDLIRSAVEQATPEEVSEWNISTSTARSGLIAVFALLAALPDVAESPTGWQDVGMRQSREQSGLLRFMAGLHALIESGDTVADAMEHIVRRHILQAHEMIAYSKLPDFTFRFRWENGYLRFFDNGVERSTIAGVRWWPISMIARDLALFEGENGQARLTQAGKDLVEVTFP